MDHSALTPSVGIGRVLYGESRWYVERGDCRDVLATLADGSVAAVMADPPYDTRTHTNARSLAGGTAHQHVIAFDPLSSLAFVKPSLRVSRGWVLAFCSLEMLGDYQREAGANWIRSGIWHRPDGAPQFTGDRPAQACEGVAIMHARRGRMSWNGGGGRAFWQYGVERRERLHDTPKPVALMAELIRLFTQLGDVVLDTHCGSATTGVACLLAGRRFIGVELDEGRHALAVERLVATESQTTVAASRAGQEALFR